MAANSICFLVLLSLMGRCAFADTQIVKDPPSGTLILNPVCLLTDAKRLLYFVVLLLGELGNIVRHTLLSLPELLTLIEEPLSALGREALGLTADVAACWRSPHQDLADDTGADVAGGSARCALDAAGRSWPKLKRDLTLLKFALQQLFVGAVMAPLLDLSIALSNTVDILMQIVGSLVECLVGVRYPGGIK